MRHNVPTIVNCFHSLPPPWPTLWRSQSSSWQPEGKCINLFAAIFLLYYVAKGRKMDEGPPGKDYDNDSRSLWSRSTSTNTSTAQLDHPHQQARASSKSHVKAVVRGMSGKMETDRLVYCLGIVLGTVCFGYRLEREISCRNCALYSRMSWWE